MMKTGTVRQSIGIDCAKDEFVAAYCCSNELRGSECKQTRAFKNNKQGFARFMAWQGKLREEGPALPMVMEATGVYHEQLACALYDGGHQVHVVLPNKAKAFTRSINLRSVDDGSSARTLALMGMERKLDPWEKPRELYSRMKHLTREREDIQQTLASAKNQLHAEETSAFTNPGTVKRLKGRIRFLAKQILEVETDLRSLIKAEKDVKERIDRVCTAPGIGWLTMTIILAETNGFHHVRNQRQLTKYAGLDVEKQDSGTSVHKPGRLSKKGNRHIRKALYMPALSRIRSEAKSKEFFKRLVSKHGVKMKAVAAVQRKTLVLAYTLWKNNATYDKQYQASAGGEERGQPRKAALNELA
ncbi:MAG: IS110 family transposase [Flavobacteriales bacterium]|nr:IS110 family transposase [Flavobacteriales bacterium]